MHGQPSEARALERYLPFWGRISEEQRDALLRVCIVRSYASGENLYIRHLGSDGLLTILEGRVRVFIPSRTSREITLFYVEQGGSIAISILKNSGENDTVPVIQADGECTLSFLGNAVIEPLMAECPEVSQFVVECISEHVRRVLNTVESYAFRPLRARAAQLIFDKLRAQSPEGNTVRTTHEEIGNHLGTSREVVSRELDAMSRRGVVKTGRGKIEVLDFEALRAMTMLE